MLNPRRCLNCGNPILDDTPQYQLFCTSWCRYAIEQAEDMKLNEYILEENKEKN